MAKLTPAALDLLIENRLNDSKEFYDAHKPQIEELVRKPMFELIEQVTDSLRKLDPEIELDPKRQISRIRRDTRFTKDKSLYRASVWCWFGRDRHAGYPAFFFEFRPEFTWWGCGLYLSDEAFLASYRKMILDRDPQFVAAKEAYEKQSRFTLDKDDMYKRTKFPNEPEDVRLWLDRKGVYASHSEPVEFAFSDKLIPTIKRDFPKLKEFYNFLMTAHERRETPETIRPWTPVRQADEW